MNWDRGFSARYYATYVDPASWRDTSQFDIISGSINRSGSALRDSADILCRDYDPALERWIRIYLVAKQGASSEHVALFTGLATSPEININGNIKEYPLQCFSVLKNAEDVFLERGWYAPAGASGASIIKELLNVCPCPVTIGDASPVLSEPVVAEDNETHLSMAEKILTTINWRLKITGDGAVEVIPLADDPAVTFDPVLNDSIEPQISLSHDWYQCPNCYRASTGTMSGVARDDDPNSALSTVRRGREVWMQDTSCELADDESIAEYAQRKLIEAQANFIKVKYTRRFHPDLFVSDNVRLHYPAQDIDGIFRIDSQTIQLGFNASTEEECSNGNSADSE